MIKSLLFLCCQIGTSSKRSAHVSPICLSTSPCNMSVRDKYFRETTCPACNLLPLESLSEGTVPGTTTIRLDKLDIASIESFAPKCDLYRLLADLSGHLKVNGREESMGYDGITYRSLCGRNEWRIRHTDLTHLSLSVDFGSSSIHLHVLSLTSLETVFWRRGSMIDTSMKTRCLTMEYA